MLGDTLRVELAPFGVQVVTVGPSSSFRVTQDIHTVQVIAGTVNTTFFENQAKYTAVPESKNTNIAFYNNNADIGNRFSLSELAKPD